MNDLTERGLTLFGELMGQDAVRAMRGTIDSGEFGSAIAKLACDWAFASVWARDGLERKQRSLVTIGVLIAQGQTAELKNHVRIGLTNGLTPREIEEAVIQALPYAGFPAVASASTAIIEVLRAMKLDGISETAAEKGLL